MKKILNWMFAAILICGTSLVVSSCGDDDDDNNSSSSSQLTSNTYEVTISVILPESAAEFFTLDLEYTGADGKTANATVKAGDKSDAMGEKMKAFYNKSKEELIYLMNWADKKEKRELLDQLIVKNFTLTVPAGKSFSYKATLKARTDYAQPSGEVFSFVLPMVYQSAKRVSGNSEDYSSLVEDISKLKAADEVESDHVAEAIKLYDGKVIADVSKSIK